MSDVILRVKRYSTDLVIEVGVIIFSVFLLVLVSDFPTEARQFPQLVLVVIPVLTTLDILKKILTKGSEQLDIDGQKGGKDSLGGEEGSPLSFRVVLMVGLMFGFLFSILLFGFTVGCFIFLTLSAWGLGYRKKMILILSSVIITAFMYAVFILIMHSLLPRGLLFGIWGN